jgi:putative ATPase
MAIDRAMSEVRKSGAHPVPLSLRNAPTKLMKELNYGSNYQYAHDYDGNFVAHDFLPKELGTHKFYEPGDNTAERKYLELLQKHWGEKYGY